MERFELHSSPFGGFVLSPNLTGSWVRMSDHEQVVADLRAELAATSKDAARWEWLKARMLSADFKADDYVGLTFELPAGSRVSANADATIDAAMGEGNGR